MSFSGLFAIGVSGVSAYATGLEAISNNIANSQTVGYRQARTDFAQLVANASSDDGTVSRGNGVSAQVGVAQDKQGFISRTSTQTNLAISGRGFFVVNDQADPNASETGRELFTRAGDFRVNDAGNLANGNGQILLGIPVTGDSQTGVGSLGSLSPIDLSSFTGQAAATDAVSLTGTLAFDGAINPQAINYNPGDPSANLSTGAITADQQQTISVFDADGQSTNLTISVLRLDNARFAVEAHQDGDNFPLVSGIISFNSDGSLNADASTLPSSVTIAGSEVDLTLSGLRQSVSGAGLSLSQQGGAAFGNVTGYEIGTDGVLRATLSNGLTPALFQIPLALFTNAEGLTRDGDTAFRFDPAAGDIELVTAGRDGGGILEASAVENSTVDITQSFAQLIQTQRACAANAQILSVTDELYETLNGTA